MIDEILGKKLKITFSNENDAAHYDYTPYSYVPKIGHKLTNHLYLDMGQGLLECLHEMHQDLKIKDKKQIAGNLMAKQKSKRTEDESYVH